MNWLQTATTILHVLLASAIVGLVLLQRGRGADAGAGFGAGASGTVFGARGSASFLSRSTAWLAALFIMTSLVLAYLGSRPGEAPSSNSVTDRVTLPGEAPPAVPPMLAPTQPAPAAPDAANSTPAPVEPAATGQGPPAPAPNQ